MMEFIHVAVVVLSLLSVGQSAPVISCERLIQPIEISGVEELLGKWTYIAESTNIPGSKLLTKMFVQSAKSQITAANESGVINILQSQKMFGSCFTLISTMTLRNGTLSIDQPFTGSMARLSTGCPDCFVSVSNYTIGRLTYSGIQLLSRRDNVTADELQEFTRQVECVNLPPPAILVSEKGFCPDDSPSQETQVTDLTKFVNGMGSEVFSLFDNIMSSEGGLQTFLKMISSAMDGLKQN